MQESYISIIFLGAIMSIGWNSGWPIEVQEVSYILWFEICKSYSLSVPLMVSRDETKKYDDKIPFIILYSIKWFLFPINVHLNLNHMVF